MSRWISAALVASVVAGAALAEEKAPRFGRRALPQEIAAWAIAVRPDGQGLPAGKGSVRHGEEIYQTQCAACHGEFGEGVGRWPALAGGQGSLKNDMPDKTVGSYWPFATTTFDYVYRAMPFGAPRSLSPDEAYALTAYLLFMNDVVDADFTLSRESFSGVKLPNAEGFIDDDRETAEKAFWRAPCMTNCKPAPAKIVGRARVIDVTPDAKTGPKVE